MTMSLGGRRRGATVLLALTAAAFSAGYFVFSWSNQVETVAVVNEKDDEASSERLRLTFSEFYRPQDSSFLDQLKQQKTTSSSKPSTTSTTTTSTTTTKPTPNSTEVQDVKSDEEAGMTQVEFDFLMESRRKKLSEACEALKAEGKGRPKYFVTEDLIAMTDDRDLYWCPVFKASTTSWLTFLMETSTQIGESMKQHLSHNAPLGRVKTISVRPSRTHFQKYLEKKPESFIVVRHPFTRLVSAYRDKLERKSDWFQSHFGAPMTAKYRKMAIQHFGKEYFSPQKNFGSPLPAPGRDGSQPSFWEFVQYIFDTSSNLANNHWKKVFEFCDPCGIRYDYIIHFENLKEEERYLKEILDKSNSSLSVPRENPTSKGMTEKEVTALYFAQLTEEEVDRLADIYREDMLVFGYATSREDVTQGL